MKVWLITVGEPLPTDSTNARLMRTGIVAEMLAARGDDVLWWTSTVNHKQKSQRFAEDTTLTVRERFQIKVLHAPGYQKNVSWQRIANHMGVARKFQALSRREAVPDVILCSLPTLELCREATRYGRQQGVPVILDVRDLWPDIFVHLAPRWGQAAARALLTPMYRSARNSCAGATAITGITQEIVDWGLHVAGRPAGPLDRDFPLAYMQKEPEEAAKAKALSFWKEQGIEANSNTFVACFFGALGKQFDMEPVMEAARRLNAGGKSFRFVFCGSGDRLELYREQAAGFANLLFPGWIGAAEIWTLMRMASVGLAPYVNRFDFTASLPNKSIEYLSAGLPVVTGLRTGVLKDLLETEQCGFVYEDAVGLETLLNHLYDNPQSLENAAVNAGRVYEERFVGERVYSEMCDYLEMVAEQYSSMAALPEVRKRRNNSEEARV